MTRQSAMTKDSKTTFTPKLRFPEFRNKVPWTLKELGELFRQREETGHDGLRLLSLTDKEGIIPQEESNRKNNASVDRSKYLRVAQGDIVYNTMRMWEGRSALATLEGIVSPAYTVCEPCEETNSLFFAHYFKTSHLVAQFARYSQGLVKDTLNLKFETFARILAATPSPAEQQKIAECLSTLDELIEAESRKLDALKDHKKGLMQQLFPREGETRPRLRFPEFRSSPDWTTRRMNEIYAFLANNSFSRDRLNYVSGSIKNIHYGDIHKHYRLLFDVTREVVPYINDDALTSESQPVFCAEGDMVFADASEDLEDIGKCIEIVNLNNERVVAGLHTILARPKTRSAFARGFSGYLFSSKRIRAQIQKESQGTKVLGISAKRLANIELCFPVHVAEQERIADCLSSLDDLIAAQSERLEALRAHKRGLMQQLFPNPCEFES